MRRFRCSRRLRASLQFILEAAPHFNLAVASGKPCRKTGCFSSVGASTQAITKTLAGKKPICVRDQQKAVNGRVVGPVIWKVEQVKKAGSHTLHRPWELIGGSHVRIADRTALLGDIRDCEVSELYEPNVIGHLAALGLFMSIGCLFVLPVVMSLARPKFLIGGALFIGLGLTLLVEIWRLRAIHLFQVDVRLQDGETITFTSTERAEVMALATAVRPGRTR